MRRGLMVVVTVVAVVLWCAGAASAGTGWAIQATPNQTGTGDNVLGGVSCTSTASCTAVGSYFVSGGLTLAEYWDGSTWVIQTTPNPAGASASGLSSVSCTSPTSCTAVGSYVIGSGPELTLAEYWDGSTWAIQATPNPANVNVATLSSVSCTSSTSCTAVGWWCPGPNCAKPDRPLAEHWDGSAWKMQATPIPAGSTATQLTGVSCHSFDSCTAAGWYEDSAGLLTLAEYWDGSTWAIQATPNAPGSTYSQLDGISCHSSTSCTATGDYFNSSGTGFTLAEHWNGSTWAVQATPNPAEATDTYLYGVSCASDTSCTATGKYYFGAYGNSRPVAEYWNGSTWAIQATPVPRDSEQRSLSGISCVAPASCTAVGGYFSGSSPELTLAEAK